MWRDGLWLHHTISEAISQQCLGHSVRVKKQQEEALWTVILGASPFHCPSCVSTWWTQQEWENWWGAGQLYGMQHGARPGGPGTAGRAWCWSQEVKEEGDCTTPSRWADQPWQSSACSIQLCQAAVGSQRCSDRYTEMPVIFETCSMWLLLLGSKKCNMGVIWRQAKDTAVWRLVSTALQVPSASQWEMPSLPELPCSMNHSQSRCPGLWHRQSCKGLWHRH